MTSDQLVTVMGGAGAPVASWIKPLPAAWSTTAPSWNLTPKTAPATGGASGWTSWL